MPLASRKSRTATPVSTLGAWLECGAAFCAATAIAGSAPAGPPANALPSIPLVGASLLIKPSAGPGTQGFQNNVPGSAPLAPTYSTATIAGQAVGTVTLYATRTILDWTSFQVGSSATLQFLFPGTTPAAIAGDIVVNRLQAPGAIDIAGVVEGLTSSANPATGGQLWFLAPGGVIFEPGSTVAAGRIVAANAFTTTANNDSAFLAASGDDAALMRNGGSLIDLRGAVTASGASIDATGAIVITGAVNTGAAGQITLESTGTISADIAAITAGILTGSSVGGASFDSGFNAISSLAGFTNSGSGDFTLNDNISLTVTGSVSTPGGLTLIGLSQLDTSAASLTAGTSGAGALTLTASASATLGPLADTHGGVTVYGVDGVLLSGPVTAAGQALSISAHGPIDASAAAITAASLTGLSVGGASFNNGANAIGAFGPFADTAGGSVTVSDLQGLTVTGVINIGTGTLTLTSGGAIAGDTATITAGTLTGSSALGASFDNAANDIATLADFNTGAGFSLFDNDPAGLTVAAINAVNGGSGDVLLHETGSPGGLALGPDAAHTGLITAGGAVTLISDNGSITQTFGAITAAGDVTLAAADAVSLATPASLGGSYSVAASSFGNQSVTLAPSFAAADATGNLTLDARSGLTLTAGLNAPGTLSITAAEGSIDTSAVSLAAGTGGAGALNLTAGGSLTVGAVADTSGASIFAATGSGGNITLTGPVTATGQTLTVNAAGTISADAAAIGAASLTGSSAGGESFANQANAIAAVANLMNTGGGNIVLIDSTPGAALQLGAVTNVAGRAGSGSISLTQAAGDVTQTAVGALHGGGDISVTVAAGRFSAGTIVAGGDIAIDARQFTSQPQSALQAGGSLAITTADPNGLVLADAAPSGSSSSWIGALSLQSSSVTIAQSDASGIDIGAATIGVGAESASLGESRSRHAGAAGGSAQAANSPAALTILTPGPVTITGHVLPAAGTTPDLTIGGTAAGVTAPSLIEIVNDDVAPPSGSGGVAPGGSIGEGVLNPNGSYSGVQAFGAVSLTAQTYILAGTSAFVAANINSTAPPSAVNPLLNMPNAGAPNLSGGVLIAADTLTLAAGGGVLQQNTSGLQTGGGSGLFSGLYVGALTLAPYGQTGPAVFDVYGALSGAGGAVISGSAAATSGLITLSVTPPSGTVYRINGCPIGEANACGGGDVLAHVVTNLGLPTAPLLGTGGDGDPPVIGPAAVDLVRKGTAAPGGLPKMSDAELLGVLTQEVDRTLADYDLSPALCYDVHVLGDDIYDELAKSDVRGVNGKSLDAALRKNDTTLRDVIDQGVFEAAQQTALYCESRAQAGPPGGAAAPPALVVEPARFGEVMARAREAVDRVPPKILVAVKHR